MPTPRPPRCSRALLVLVLLALSGSAAAVRAQTSDPAAVLRAGDRVCLVGNSLAERLQHDGWLEARLQCARPELGLSFRNLGFTGDTLTVRQRTEGFGTPDEWLARCHATVVLGFFGFNESFAGDAGLPKFRADLAAWLEHVQAPHADGSTTLRIVLVSPTPAEELHDRDLPAAAPQNARLAPYVEAMRDVAHEHGVPFVDLFTPLLAEFARGGGSSTERLTIDGIHLTERGDARVAQLLGASLAPDARDTDAARLAAVRALVIAKDDLWWNRYRVTDGNNVYGGRSSLSYDGVTNFVVLQRELEILDAEVAQQDERIAAAARGDTTLARSPAGKGDIEVPPPIPVATNRPGNGPGGAHEFLDGEAAIASMTPAPGMAVNLFADEQRFPELANPVQMAWDTRGRLWVAAWPTYPHWAPNDPTSDRILILEDTDGDGRADSCKVFADDLHNPTGLEFWNGGVFVAEAPDLLFMRDTDGDDRADVVERVLGGISTSDTHHTANSFVLGPDGALYFQEGIFHQSQIESIYGPVRNHDACVWRYEPRTRRVERYAAYGFLNPHGHVFDRWGEDFLTDGTTNENYVAGPMAGFVEEPRKHGATAPFFPQRSRPAAGTEILSSRQFPAENQGNLLIANVIGFQGIFQYHLADDGAGFAATEVAPLVHSTDPNFRPVDIEVGPDGAVYFLDWQAPLIGHMQHHLRDPGRDHSHGRIYRVSCPGQPVPVPMPIAGRPIPELLELLRSPEDRVRYRARIELSARSSDEVVAAARAWAARREADDVDADHASDREHDLLEALWLQEQHDVLDVALLQRVLTSPEPHARAAAVRVLRVMRDSPALASAPDGEREVRDGERAVRDGLAAPDTHAALALLAAAATDADPRVRMEAVVACSFFPEARAAEIALSARRAGHDRFLDEALDETLATLAPQWHAALASGAPFAADDPEALAFALAKLDTAELAGVRPCEALDAELLSRPGVSAETIARAAASLAARHATSAAQELLAAIRRADLRTDAHADHVLSGLFEAVASLESGAHEGAISAAPAPAPADNSRTAVSAAAPVDAATRAAAGASTRDEARAALAAPMAALAVDGHRASTRRLATVARLRADRDVDGAWREASASPAALADLLDALPLLHDPALADALFPRVLALLDAPAAAHAGGSGASTAAAPSEPATVGRFVRVELPGPARTLTLAEVQVFSRGENVARRGTASQSSDAWGGLAARAIDGNTSGAFGDGGQTHTVEDQPDAWWEVDLGAERPLERIVLWNRSEEGGRWVTRLDGCVVRVLDAARRTTFERHLEHAPTESVALQVGSPAQAVRRAAVAALPTLGVREADAVTALVARFGDDELRGAIVAALSSVPSARWPAAARAALADALLADFTTAPPADFETDAGRARLALADELLPSLRADEAVGGRSDSAASGAQVADRGSATHADSLAGDAPAGSAGRAAHLAAARERLGPQVIVIRPVPDSLRFDRAEFAVAAGRRVELVFENRDIMPHNLVLAAPGALATVGLAGERMAADPDAGSRGWVPDVPQVLHAIPLLNPGESRTLAFDAPAAPGDYPYVCTFPGHWLRMNGVMHVTSETDLAATRDAIDARAAAAALAANARAQDGVTSARTGGGTSAGAAPATGAGTSGAAPARPFVKLWTIADFSAGLDGVDRASPQRGRAVMEAASCLRCHAIAPAGPGAGEGGHTGPELRGVVAVHPRAELLAQILAPSATIAKGFGAELFFLRGGGVVSGRVLGEDADVVSVLDDPYSGTPRRVLRADIEERRASDVSIMPEGLLSTFSRDEILDLLAYLESLRPAGATAPSIPAAAAAAPSAPVSAPASAAPASPAPAADIVLRGFFRIDPVYFHPAGNALAPDAKQPWLPAPAAPDLAAPGSLLPPEFHVDPSQLEALLATGQEPAVPVDVLTPRFDIDADGRMELSWVGAAPGLIAMQAGSGPGGAHGLASYHAVESATREPLEFVVHGLPPAREGSLTFDLSDYADKAVATRLTIHAPAGGVILVTRREQGGISLQPGRRAK